MKLIAFSIFLYFFSHSAYAAIAPSMSINNDPVCEVYKVAYLSQLSSGAIPSFDTVEVQSHADGSSYSNNGTSVVPIKFSKPFTHPEVEWLEWLPIPNKEHSFKWGGTATNVTATSSIKPSGSTSFVFQVNTIGWRGPFYRVWLMNDNKLQKIVKNMQPAKKTVPIEGTGAKLVFPYYERSFSRNLTNLFKYQDDFYTATDDQVSKVTKGTPEVVCQVGLKTELNSAQIQALEKAANSSLMTKGITHIPMYYGSMGNPHWVVKNGFQTAINKPWLIMTTANGECFANDQLNNCEKNKRVEAVLQNFAASDPWSFREIEALRHHMNSVKLVLNQYYKDELKLDKAIANGMATQAIYNFLERTVSLHPYIRYGVEMINTASNSYTLDTPGKSLKTNWFNKTELMWAAHFNDYDAITRLLSNGANLSEVTNTDDTYASVQFLNRSALTYAVENATLPLIQKLLAHGADGDIEDSKGNTLASYLNKNPSLDLTWDELTKSQRVTVKASFNCAQAKSKQEKAICSSQGLSVYDQQLGQLYKKVRNTNQYPEIKTLQRRWLKALRTECTASGDELVNCMKEKYRSRIKYLMNLL